MKKIFTAFCIMALLFAVSGVSSASPPGVKYIEKIEMYKNAPEFVAPVIMPEYVICTASVQLPGFIMTSYTYELPATKNYCAASNYSIITENWQSTMLYNGNIYNRCNTVIYPKFPEAMCRSGVMTITYI